MITPSLELFEATLRAADYLERTAVDEIGDFVLKRMEPDGSFRGRDDKGDLYYTAFGVACLLALGKAFPRDRVGKYLDGFGDVEDLDLVHLTCLARTRTGLRFARLARFAGSRSRLRLVRLARKWGGPRVRKLSRNDKSLLDRLERYRDGDGGFRQEGKVAEGGSVYASFLALLTYEDLGVEMPDPEGLVRTVESHRSRDGAYANRRGLEWGTTTVTSAAVVLLKRFGASVDSAVGEWLWERACDRGGFFASPKAPIPDLLSTATALHALRLMEVPIDKIRDGSIEFVESLWNASGGFSGHLADATPDVEYTYYGLLALGHLADSGG